MIEQGTPEAPFPEEGDLVIWEGIRAKIVNVTIEQVTLKDSVLTEGYGNSLEFFLRVFWWNSLLNAWVDNQIPSEER